MRAPLVNGPTEPLFGDLPRISTMTALAEHTPTSHVDPAEQWAETCRTAWVDLALDGDRLLGRPRAAVGYISEITGTRLREWARAEVPAWRVVGMDDAAWDRAAELLRDGFRAQEAARLAEIPADQRRADELAEQRRREQRRVVLQRELAALGDGEQTGADPVPETTTIPAAPAAPKPGGWLRRSTTP